MRIFNAYGPGQRIPPSHPPIIPGFLRNALSNSSVVIHGDGKQTRDYIYIDDLVNAMVTSATAVGVDQEVINIGSGVETSVLELVRLVRLVTGKKPEEIFNPHKAGGADRIALTSASQRKTQFRRWCL